MKLLSSTWKNKEYDSNEEIDRQMEKVIKLAGKYSYSPKVIEGLSSFFSSKSTLFLKRPVQMINFWYLPASRC